MSALPPLLGVDHLRGRPRIASGQINETNRNNIVRDGRLQDVEDELSEFPHVVLNQARVHNFYLQVMRNAPNRLEPDYARRLIDLRTDSAVSSPHSPQSETLRLSLSGMGGGRPKSL
jgi:hypothetical protein